MDMSVNTRLYNNLCGEGLTVEDFAILDPKLCLCIRNLGKKSVYAIIECLEEKGMKPGVWCGLPRITWYRAIEYYRDHKEEIRKENPIVYINKPKEIESGESKSIDWDTYRKEAAKDILSAIIEKKSSMCSYGEVVEEAIKFADELIKQLKEK